MHKQNYINTMKKQISSHSTVMTLLESSSLSMTVIYICGCCPRTTDETENKSKNATGQTQPMD